MWGICFIGKLLTISQMTSIKFIIISYLPHLHIHNIFFSQQPSCAVTTKKFTYLLVKTGTLMLKACSDLKGYTPGQVIKLSAEIHNKSGKDTGCVMASLIQVSPLTSSFIKMQC